MNKIESLQTANLNCSPSSASVGQTITLTASASGGTAPYTLQFCHIVNNTCQFIESIGNVNGGQNVTSGYTIQSGDTGTLTFRVVVADSAGHIFGQNCYVSVTSATPTPTGCINIPIINTCISKTILIISAGAVALLLLMKKK